MYAMPKVHVSNNILVKTRRGFPQKLETLEKNFRENTNLLTSNSLKPVFNLNENGKKYLKKKDDQETLIPQHEEMIKYIQTTWSNVIEEYESKSSSKTLEINNLYPNCSSEETSSNILKNSNVAKITYFNNKTSAIPKFEPFDLENFCWQRIYQKLISN